MSLEVNLTSSHIQIRIQMIFGFQMLKKQKPDCGDVKKNCIDAHKSSVQVFFCIYTSSGFCFET